MQERAVRQVPLIDGEGRVAALCTIDELLPQQLPPLQAVIMAGGFGVRLHPLTDEVPKPMLPVGDRPLIEHIITQLRDAGIRQVSISTHYKPEAIVEHFGDGRRFGVNIDYVNEERPLGTAGALGLMPAWPSTLLVMNGDIVTRMNYQSMLLFHQENGAVATVGVRQYDFQVPYGVIESDGVHVRRVSEKPRLQFFVNAGVYLLEPVAHQYLPRQQRCDMTELIERLLADGQPVVSFPISEYWLDIGQPADYQKAQADFEDREGSA
jgi:NDP-sugar pyrophosphorylase family protein